MGTPSTGGGMFHNGNVEKSLDMRLQLLKQNIVVGDSQGANNYIADYLHNPSTNLVKSLEGQKTLIKPKSEDPRKKASLLYSTEETFSPGK